jgi:hypothetical protein
MLSCMCIRRHPVAHDTFRLKLPIQQLVEHMLNQLPDHVWQDPDVRFLDPAFGGGQFVLAIRRRLLAAGHSQKSVTDRVWGCESLPTRVKYVQNWFKSGLDNLYVRDPLTHDWGLMKFDVIVGNPPYQDNMPDGARKSISTNLWTKFIDKSVNELLAPNGWCGMVVPASWAGPTKNLSNGRRILKDIFAANNTTMLNLDPGLNSHFQQVGSTFSWFMTQKAPYAGVTKIQLNATEHVDVDLSQVESLPRINHVLAYSINQKYFQKASTSDVVAGQYRVSDDQYQEQKTAQYKHPAYHTPAEGGRTWYMKTKHPNHAAHKVIISLSGRYVPVADAGTQGYTDMCLAYIVKDGETLDSVLSVLNSKLFHFIMNANKWSGFNNKQVIRTFALPKLNKVYTDVQIYKWFGLTKEESDFVTNWYQNNISG